MEHSDDIRRLRERIAELEADLELARAQLGFEAVGSNPRELAGSLVHDFNNLLTSVLGYVDLAARTVDQGTEMAEYIQRIRTAVAGGVSLTHQLLAEERRQAGKDPAPDSARATRHDLPGGNETVLLVEDRAAVREVSRRMLEHLGYHVLESADAEQAMTVFKADPDRIDLLFTDVVMPGINGVELCLALSRVRPGLPMICASGNPFAARDALQESSLPFIQKPFTLPLLARRLREVLDRSA